MDIATTLNEITALSLEDRILLVQAIWDSITAEQAYPDLTEAQKDELDRRIDNHADQLAESLKFDTDSTIQTAWFTEAKRRQDEVRNGSVQPISGEDALTQVRQLIES